ncbi:hypothetical protein MSG28_015885 [Choristoneura fumiferana]|uniref:Uncharacterized protein n=1 Tax=Choristoneura fumiferana TaxID=7141 RepID=A0ACC0K5C0_CHOFU|nr:hypothetical protein MSG28_015885 [Choristoneura fumiferana]
MFPLAVCQGCLTYERRLVPIGKHAKLYQSLLLTKINNIDKQRKLCWECHKMLDNIYSFRLKITEAQKLLHNSCLAQYNSLSTLSPTTKVNDYNLIVNDEIKHTIPMEFDISIKHEDPEGINLVSIIEPKDVKPSVTSKLKLDTIQVEIVKNEDDTHFDDGIDDIGLISDLEFKDEKDIKVELDEPLVSLDILEKKSEIIVKKVRKKRGVLKQKYRTIILGDIPDKRKLYDKVKLDYNGVQEWLQQKRASRNQKRFQCERCYSGFATKKYYDRHLEVRHAKRLGKYECDVCGFRFGEKSKLAYHIRSHFVQFVCKLCGARTYTRGEMYAHFTHGPHGRLRECRVCGMRFECPNRREFFDHYRELHEKHVCDHCGKNYLKKKTLISHIAKLHTIYNCNICNVTYSTRDSYKRHQKEKHEVDMSEQNYCVECNMQFMNSATYNIHIRSSVKHRPTRAYPCPDCGKVYTKNISMRNHYKLVHLKKSDYHCAICDTYYLTGHRLRYHQKYFHDKLPKPKNKLCKYCGKGFNNNRILDNHVRTHTGERPFGCEFCSAAFTQKQSLTAHLRSAHK